MQCANFTLESFELKGNYCVTISYMNSDETNFKFLEFLDANRIDQLNFSEPLIIAENEKKMESKTPSPLITSLTENSAQVDGNKRSEFLDVPFMAYRISRITCPARKLNLY